jgi:hypothetical protein
MREKKPLIALDAQVTTKLRAAGAIANLSRNMELKCSTLGGPRLSGWPGGYTFALGVVVVVISNL